MAGELVGPELLNAPCGHGRIANRLAARGLRGTVAQPPAAQLAGMLREAGFHDVRALDETGERYGSHSRRLLMIAR